MLVAWGKSRKLKRICFLFRLTPWEMEILEVLSQRHSNSKIASKFKIYTNMVKFYLKNIYEKIPVGSQTHVVYFYNKLFKEEE